MSLKQVLSDAAALYAAGRYEEAVTAYRGALNLAVGHVGILHNLGVTLAAAGRLDEAAMNLRAASDAEPKNAAISLSLGHVEFRRGRLEAAEQAFATAAENAPNSVDANYNLGYVRQQQGSAAEAIPAFEAARALDPKNERIWYELLNATLAHGRFEQAYADFLAFHPAAALTPTYFQAALRCIRALGDPEREANLLRSARGLEYTPADTTILAGILPRLQYFDVSRDELLRLYRTYDRLMNGGDARPTPLARSTRLPGERIRIGYLSADFRMHVMGRAMVDVIEAHDRNRYAVHLYSLKGSVEPDPIQDRFRRAADRFVELPGPDDKEAARLIAADDCDVLVDLMGHTVFSRPALLTAKPSRVIVTHLGYHGAVGLSQVDFKLTDRYADVADAGDYQLERPLTMASCVFPFRRPSGDFVNPPLRTALDIADDAVVLGEFVAALKLAPRCLALWRSVLEQVPEAVLLFSPTSADEQPGLLRQLASCGIGATRVRFVPRGIDEAAERARYGLVDLVLDTVPYSGGDTTVAALEAGVPVVTLAGTRHAERMTSSILRHLGLDELVTASEENYVRLAVSLASDHAQRANVAARVAEKYAEAASAQPVRYTRDLEAALDFAIASALPIRH